MKLTAKETFYHLNDLFTFGCPIHGILMYRVGDGVHCCFKENVHNHLYFTQGTGISTPEDIKNYEAYVSNRS